MKQAPKVSEDNEEEEVENLTVSNGNAECNGNGATDLLTSKIDDLLATFDDSISDDEEEEEDANSLVDDMAEEGEEDTPSEGSNDIIDHGEEINTTESEVSNDEDYDDQDSFIDDDESHELLSGEEYDLSWDGDKRKSRIVQLSSDSDKEVVTVKRREKKVVKKKKNWSRIKKLDSSDEEHALEESVKEESPKEEKKIIIHEHIIIKPSPEQNKKEETEEEEEEEELKNVAFYPLCSKNEVSEEEVDIEPIKKNKTSKTKALDTDKTLLQEAIATNKRKAQDLDDYLDWEVTEIVLRPSKKPKHNSDFQTMKLKKKRKKKEAKAPNAVLPTPKKKNVKSSVNVAQIPSRDFRNAVLYDKSRVKRVDTQKVLRKNMWLS